MMAIRVETMKVNWIGVQLSGLHRVTPIRYFNSCDWFNESGANVPRESRVAATFDLSRSADQLIITRSDLLASATQLERPFQWECNNTQPPKTIANDPQSAWRMASGSAGSCFRRSSPLMRWSREHFGNSRVTTGKKKSRINRENEANY